MSINNIVDFDISKVKLIIWDLDETFWNGTISEGEIEFIEQNVEIVKIATDCGIINSICSKNEYSIVEKTLKEQNLFEYFIYPSVNWESKGHRVKEQIKALQLRDSNVLFVDDNESNLEEVKFYNPNIMTLNAENIDCLYKLLIGIEKKDVAHKRLNQYKILEKKLIKMGESKSNIDFLISCNIKVLVHKDCSQQLDRIHEMIMRTNQLNYTKKRISKEELSKIIESSEYENAYVSATDNFGDYGIVGFYSIKNGELEHFLFSCRCMGMGIEQYIYSQLNFPKLNVVGNVSVPLNNIDIPDYINKSDKNGDVEVLKRSSIDSKTKILLKGPCDVSAIFSFIEKSENINCEFTYVSPETGLSIEQHNHSQCILESLTLTEERKNEIISELPFGDKNMYDQTIFTEKYDIVFFSLLTDCGLGLYRRKETGEYTSFLQYKSPITDPKNIDAILSDNSNKIDEKKLRSFAQKYDFVGRLSPERIVDNIKRICSNLDKSTLFVLLLGSEIPYKKNKDLNYDNRHVFHKEVNDLIKELAKSNNQIKYIEYTELIKSQADFYDNINHYMRPVYYRIAEKILFVVNEHLGLNFKRKNKTFLLYATFKQFAKKVLKKIKWI